MAQRDVRDTRALILSTARAMFSAHTYRATSMREIAEQVGITKPSLYHHFRSKTEILESLISTPVNELAAAVENAAGADSHAEVQRRVLRGAIDVIVDHRDVMALLFRDASVYTSEATDLVTKVLGITARATELLAGPDPDWRAQLRAAQALAAATDPIAHFTDVPREDLRAELLAGARIVLGLGPDAEA